MRVFFVGATKFGLSCLETLLGLENIEVVGALTAPRDFKISYSEKPVSNVLHADFEPIARANDFPIFHLQSSMSASGLSTKVFERRPDCLLVAGWYHMIPSSWINKIPSYGFHASLLPEYRGGAPLVWAMIRGETRTGLTLFQMDDGIDTGPIFSSREILIHKEDDIGDLLRKSEKEALDILRQDFVAIASGSGQGRAQPAGDYPVMPQRSPLDGEIDWSQPAAVVTRFIRAQTKPYPGAFFEAEGNRITVWRASIVNGLKSIAAVGSVRSYHGDVVVKCENSWVRLENFESEGSQSRALEILLGFAQQCVDARIFSKPNAGN